MPAKDSFWLEDMKQVLELVDGSFGLLFQACGENSQGHFLSPIWFDGLILFSLQNA